MLTKSLAVSSILHLLSSGFKRAFLKNRKREKNTPFFPSNSFSEAFVLGKIM